MYKVIITLAVLAMVVGIFLPQSIPFPDFDKGRLIPLLMLGVIVISGIIGVLSQDDSHHHPPSIRH